MVPPPASAAATMPSGESVSSLLLEAASGLAALHSQIVTPHSPEAPSDDEYCESAESEESRMSPSPALNETSGSSSVSVSVSCATKPKFSGTSFPERLMAMLSDPASFEAVSWLPDGQSFIVTSPKKLAIEILPRYFGGQRAEFSSFTRKLYWWGFRKSAASRTTKYDSFSHEMFQKDRPELAAEMKGRQMRQRNDGPALNAKKALIAARAIAATKKTASEEPKAKTQATAATSLPMIPTSSMSTQASAEVMGPSPDFKSTSTSSELLPAMNAAALHQALSSASSVATTPATVSNPSNATAGLAAQRLLSSVTAAPSPSVASLGLPTVLDMPARLSSPQAAVFGTSSGTATVFHKSPTLLTHHAQHTLSNQRAVVSPASESLAVVFQQQAQAAKQKAAQQQQYQQALLVTLASIQAARQQQEQEQQKRRLQQQREHQQRQAQAAATAAVASAVASASQAPVVIHVHHHHVRR